MTDTVLGSWKDGQPVRGQESAPEDSDATHLQYSDATHLQES